jgi:2-dehydro-3-deoxyphosphogluconate aldolase/(4S)-4-hydroxy-2-oxoglutarate aldolase
VIPTPTPPLGFDLVDELMRQRILAIVRSDNANGCYYAAMTLIEEGVNLVEVSLSGHGAVDVITRVRNAAPDALVGAGTVLTREDTQAVYESGALFVVTPGLAPSVAAAGEIGLPILCGALTPTEVIEAMGQGATAVKVFPAFAWGPGYIAALRAPFPDTPLVAVGGVGIDDIGAYLEAGAVAVGLGSPLLGDTAKGGDLEGLRRRARAALSAAAAAGR